MYKGGSGVLFLSCNNRVIGGLKLSIGGINGTVMDVRIILGIALKCLASGILIAHTHPSGELIPSSSDIGITTRLGEAAKLLQVKLLDHLIITASGYMSFIEEGLILVSS